MFNMKKGPKNNYCNTNAPVAISEPEMDAVAAEAKRLAAKKAGGFAKLKGIK